MSHDDTSLLNARCCRTTSVRTSTCTALYRLEANMTYDSLFLKFDCNCGWPGPDCIVRTENTQCIKKLKESRGRCSQDGRRRTMMTIPCAVAL